MSQQTQGKRYETQLANDLDLNSHPDVRAFPIGYSGNHARPAPDILVTADARCHAIELKKTSVDEDEHFYIDIADLQQLFLCMNKWTTPHLAVKFNRRELMVVRNLDVGDKQNNIEDIFETWLSGLIDNIPDCFDAHRTTSALRLTKPSTDEWNSSRAGKPDAEVLADQLIIEYLPFDDEDSEA